MRNIPQNTKILSINTVETSNFTHTHTAPHSLSTCVCSPVTISLVTHCHEALVWISCNWHACILLSITNKMHRYTIFFIIFNALHVSGGFSAHQQELKNCTHSIWYMSSLLAATASMVELELQLNHTSGAASKPGMYQMLCVQFLSSWWWVEKLPETCRALTIIKNIV
jgi:hypothetical protein